MPQQRLVAERRWRLGVQSRGHPSAIIAELLRALRTSQVCLQTPSILCTIPCASSHVWKWSLMRLQQRLSLLPQFLAVVSC